MAKKAKQASRGGGGGGSKRKWLGLLLILIGIIGGLAAYVFFQVTAEVETRSIDPGDGLDAAEATRKIKALDDASKRSAKGFIRLSEPEINAHLAKIYKGNTNSHNGLLHVRSAVNLGPDHFTLFTWVKKSLPFMPIETAWQRKFELSGTGPAKQFKLVSMKIGNLTVPENEWARVEKFLGPVDAVYSNEVTRLLLLPAIELRSVAGGRGFEARFYNYDPATTSVIQGMPAPPVNGSKAAALRK
jgi:hypothetical protein